MQSKNQPLEKLDPEFVRENIKVVTFDLDGVVVPTGTYLRQSADGTELTIKTHKLSESMADMLNELKEYVWINFSSGRSLLHLETMVEDVLWDNVSLMGENGNFIFINGEMKQLSFYETSYFQKLVDIRQDLKGLQKEKPNILHGFEPKHIIVTVHTSEKVTEVKEIVAKHDPEEELYCLWTSEGYDIGHKETNKKTALEFLAEETGIEPREMITTGNNLNDKEMLGFGTGVSVDPDKVDGEYAIPKKEGQLGGEVLAEYLLHAFRQG